MADLGAIGELVDYLFDFELPVSYYHPSVWMVNTVAPHLGTDDSRLELVLPYVPHLLEGSCEIVDGLPEDYEEVRVVIIDLTANEQVADLPVGPDGSWSLKLGAGQYARGYIKPGCALVFDGPYELPRPEGAP